MFHDYMVPFCHRFVNLPNPYRSSGIIHRQPGEPSQVCSPEQPVNNSGRAMPDFFLIGCVAILSPGFAARPGRRMPNPKRSTFQARNSPPDGGFCPMTNAQNFSPASGRDEFYKDFAGRSQAGISQSFDNVKGK
jgi:hypothetical protein